MFTVDIILSGLKFHVDDVSTSFVVESNDMISLDYSNLYLGNIKEESVVILVEVYIGSYAFYNCSSIKHFEMGDIETINDHAFYGCNID